MDTNNTAAPNMADILAAAAAGAGAGTTAIVEAATPKTNWIKVEGADKVGRVSNPLWYLDIPFDGEMRNIELGILNIEFVQPSENDKDALLYARVTTPINVDKPIRMRITAKEYNGGFSLWTPPAITNPQLEKDAASGRRYVKTDPKNNNKEMSYNVLSFGNDFRGFVLHACHQLLLEAQGK